MNYKKNILDYCKSIGIDKELVGFMECRAFEELKPYFNERKNKGLTNEFEEQDIEKKINPFIYMENGKTIISIAFPYLFNNEFNSNIGFSKYTLGNDYHKVVSSYLKNICEFIRTLGGEAIHLVDSNSLPERYIAVQSGIGFVGKNNTLITEKYGSYVFLGEIITNLKMESNEPIESKCGSCDLCQNACPTGAIKTENNPNICLSYITQKKEIEDEWFLKLKGRIFGCDTCQRVCPFNKNAKSSNIMEFKPYSFMENLDLEELANINKKIFNEKYIKTSCGWRGKNIIQRNSLINIFESKQNIKIKEINSAYVKEYYDRLSKFFKL